MKGPFVKIVTSKRPAYVNSDEIESIESDSDSIRIETESRSFYEVTEVNGVQCKSIDEVAKVLNDTYEDFQSMEKLVAITTSQKL